ncbi:hypothetical protein [Tolypothrix sp. VBCCA 56010]|uniref:hypothetical protein n=1 Tax=Tolypothrix sp. VBCCA 56010 TaxID=3137731 RepID=UPI003D7D0357
MSSENSNRTALRAAQAVAAAVFAFSHAVKVDARCILSNAYSVRVHLHASIHGIVWVYALLPEFPDWAEHI